MVFGVAARVLATVVKGAKPALFCGAVGMAGFGYKKWDEASKVLRLDYMSDSEVDRLFDRIDSDGCMSTNDTVLLLASGASNKPAQLSEFTAALTEVCLDLARQLIADAEGSTKDIKFFIFSRIFIITKHHFNSVSVHIRNSTDYFFLILNIK